MTPSALDERADALRRSAADLLDTLTRSAEAFALPAPPAVLDTCRRRLLDNSYRVLVTGEAKRGKSTFVNALLGRAVLPTAVDVATCQVFHVRRAEKEAYRLRFEDGSAREVTLADLPRYGSQVVADAEGVPSLSRVLRWIEVEVPARFLPEGVSVLDTPGLGALYAAHAQITQRFVPHADAVIFALDSQAPIGEPEVRFLEEVLKATRSVFFIQTRIDQFRRGDWQAVQARNQAILAERFAGRLPDTRVWPVSSTNLFKAAATGDDDYLAVSRHKELEPALRAFLFRAAGWGRAAEAVLAAEAFHRESRAVLQGRLDALERGPGAGQDGGLTEFAEEARRFESEWGQEGGARRELLGRLVQAAERARRSFAQALAPGGPVEVEAQERIDALQGGEQARQLAGSLSAEVVAAAGRHWREAAARFQSGCLDLLRQLLQDAQQGPGADADAGSGLAVRSGRGLDLGDSGFEKTLAASKGLYLGATGAAGAGYVLVTLIATSWFPPLAVAGVVGVGLWGALYGWKRAVASQLKTARQELHAHLGEVLKGVRRHYLGEDGSPDEGGCADEYLREQLERLAAHVAEFADRRSDGLRRELQLRAKESALEGGRRQARAEELHRQLAEWDQIGQSVAALREEIQELERAAPR